MKIKLTESQVLNLIKEDVVNEQIYTDFDSVWDYNRIQDKWHTRRKSKPNGKWINISHIPAAVKKLNAKYGTKSPSKLPKLGTLVPPPVQSSDRTPNRPIPPSMEIDKTAAANLPQLDKNLNVIDKEKHKKKEYKDKIDFASLPIDKEVDRICTADTAECAQFVNDFSNKVDYVGDAWLAHDTDKVGKRFFSVYQNGLSRDIILGYYNIFKKYFDYDQDSKKVIPKSNAGDATTSIKNLQSKIIKSKPQPTNLKQDDIVGIYNPDSDNHVNAFVGSANYGRGYYPNGRMGRTLRAGRGHSLNTHVGVVGTVKDGVPLIFHNIHGNIKSTPANQLPIVWVKRQV